MSLRDTDSVAKQLRDIILELNEAKTAQRVGNSQIVVTEYVSDTVSTTSDSNGYFSEAYAVCSATAPFVQGTNVLITYCVPEVRLNGALINNADLGVYAYYVMDVQTGSTGSNAYQLTIYHSSGEGETVPVETYTVKFHIYSAAEVELSARSGTYE